MSEQLPDPEILSGFLDEAGQCVSTLNEKLLIVESGEQGEELVGEMFRAAHSMKGSAGFLNLTDIAKVTHSLETVLDAIRKNKLTFAQNVIDALFSAFDTVSALLAEVAAGDQGTVEISDVVNELEAVLNAPPEGDEQKAEAPATVEKGPEDELGPLPDWLRARISIDEVLEGMIALKTGKKLYALLFSLKDAFAHNQSPVVIQSALESVVEIQKMYPVLSAPPSPWRPLTDYDYQIGMFVFSDGPIRDAILKTSLSSCTAWLLGESEALPDPEIITAEVQASVGTPVSSLVVRPDMEKHKGTWLSETREELDQMDAALLAYEEGPTNMEHLNAMFRLMHRLKSSCASIGLDEMSRVAHNCESLLSRYRESGETPLPESFTALFQSKDFLNECLGRVEQGIQDAPDVAPIDAVLIKLLSSKEATKPATSNEEALVLNDAEQSNVAAFNEGTVWHVRIRLQHDTPMPDLRYAMILRNLRQSFTILACRPTLETLENGVDSPPPLQVVLGGSSDEDMVRDMLEFDMVKTIDLQPYAVMPNRDLARDTAASASKSASSAPSTQSDTVRVDTTRLDTLMNVAGELVITKARVTQLTDMIKHQLDLFDTTLYESLVWQAEQHNKNGDREKGLDQSLSPDRLNRLHAMGKGLQEAQDTAAALRDTLQELHRHTNTVQNTVMQARMVPIGPLFQRFHRLIRDLCKQRNRQAKLYTAGEGTELDKKLIDELTDPLTHLIRNGVDHGLEASEDRVKSGKPAQGSVRLEAFHEGGQICIRVKDDGRGLDMEKIKAKAITNNLATTESLERMTEQEIYQLIFQPGFSTAAQVTNISGRGVGMDIVKSKVNELKGKIDIESTPGEGTVFTIRLPLTLAMIDGLLVEIGDTRYAFPLESVREIMELGDDDLKSVEGRGVVTFLRDQAIALVDLEHVIDANPMRRHDGRFRAVVIRTSNETLAIAVDRVIGDEEIVVKALSEEFSHVRGISGATVLGDGGIALILDVPAICELSQNHNPGHGEKGRQFDA